MLQSGMTLMAWQMENERPRNEVAQRCGWDHANSVVDWGSSFFKG